MGDQNLRRLADSIRSYRVQNLLVFSARAVVVRGAARLRTIETPRLGPMRLNELKQARISA
jgi:hypothetical protein